MLHTADVLFPLGGQGLLCLRMSGFLESMRDSKHAHYAQLHHA
jgi:hypothetical protein